MNNNKKEIKLNNNKKEIESKNAEIVKKAKKKSMVNKIALKIGELSGYICITIGIIMAILILTTYKF